jgi:glutathione S-transferase
VFARDSQIYLLALGNETLTPETHSRASDGFRAYLGGINQALASSREFIVGHNVTLADICFVAELSLFYNEEARAAELMKRGLPPILNTTVDTEFPKAMSHFIKLSKHPAFAPDVEPIWRKLKKPFTPNAERPGASRLY